jgi:branched-chain amino acid transport system substrate-binding protein
MRGSLLAVMLGALTTAPALAEDTVRVGSVAAITGPVADVVPAIMAGRQLAADHVNSHGGLLDGKTMELVPADSQCDPKAGVDAGNKVVNVDQVVAVIGTTCSGATNAMVQSVTIPAGIASISDSATAPSITELDDNDLVFRTAPSDAHQGRALAQVAWENGARKVAVTYANDDYNAGIARVFEEVFRDMGGEIAASQVHEPNKASYRSEVFTLARGDPDALALFAYYGGSGITIIRNALEAGTFGKFFLADGMFDQTVIDQIGADALRGNVWLTQATSDPEDSGYATFAEAYEATGHDPQAPYAAHGYDATMLMALAIEKAGSTERRAIADALMVLNEAQGEVVGPGEWGKAKQLIDAGNPINYEGASGSVDFDANGDVPGIYGVNVVGEDGAWSKTILK